LFIVKGFNSSKLEVMPLKADPFIEVK